MSVAAERFTPPPPVPRTLEDVGLPAERVEHLLVKTLFAGELIGLEIAERMKLAYAILEPLIVRLRTERLIEVRGASAAASSSYRYALTDLGRGRALQYLEINLYTGATPVPLSAYVAQMKALQAARGFIDRERLRKGFSHLVIGDEVLEKLGVKQIPQSLSEALATMERSTLVQEALGEHIFEWFLRNKRSEWRGYKTHVSAFERDRYLTAL